jgi:hypothetical protein
MANMRVRHDSRKGIFAERFENGATEPWSATVA